MSRHFFESININSREHVFDTTYKSFRIQINMDKFAIAIAIELKYIIFLEHM